MIHNQYPVSRRDCASQAQRLVPTGLSSQEKLGVVESILTRPDLDDRDVRLLLLMLSWQAQERRVTQSDLSLALHVSLATVTRRLRALRERGTIVVTRIGSKEWEYDLSPLASILSVVPNPPDQDSDSKPEADESTPPRPDFVSSHQDDYPPLAAVTTHMDDYSLPFPSLLPIRKGTIGDRKDILLLHSEGERTVRVTGPDSTLKKQIQDSTYPSKPTPPVDESSQTRFGVSFKPKKVRSLEKLNCLDMEGAFRRMWREKWRGHPIRWTLREKKHIKDLIADHGAPDVLTYLCFVFDHWEALKVRYGLTGFPTVNLLYGWRRTLLPESQNPVRTMSTEFTDDESANEF